MLLYDSSLRSLRVVLVLGLAILWNAEFFVVIALSIGLLIAHSVLASFIAVVVSFSFINFKIVIPFATMMFAGSPRNGGGERRVVGQQEQEQQQQDPFAAHINMQERIFAAGRVNNNTPLILHLPLEHKLFSACWKMIARLIPLMLTVIICPLYATVFTAAASMCVAVMDIAQEGLHFAVQQQSASSRTVAVKIRLVVLMLLATIAGGAGAWLCVKYSTNNNNTVPLHQNAREHPAIVDFDIETLIAGASFDKTTMKRPPFHGFGVDKLPTVDDVSIALSLLSIEFFAVAFRGVTQLGVLVITFVIGYDELPQAGDSLYFAERALEWGLQLAVIGTWTLHACGLSIQQALEYLVRSSPSSSSTSDTTTRNNIVIPWWWQILVLWSIWKSLGNAATWSEWHRVMSFFPVATKQNIVATKRTRMEAVWRERRQEEDDENRLLARRRRERQQREQDQLDSDVNLPALHSSSSRPVSVQREATPDFAPSIPREEGFDCAICLMPIALPDGDCDSDENSSNNNKTTSSTHHHQPGVLLKCCHVYHSACLRRALAQANPIDEARCALCRAKIFGPAAGTTERVVARAQNNDVVVDRGNSPAPRP